MPRPATGQIWERPGANGDTYRTLRFRVGGRRHTMPLGVVPRAEAEHALACLMADISRGLWKPPTRAQIPPAQFEMPTFHEYAEEWWTRNERQWAQETVRDYRWKLECHLLPAFRELRLDDILVNAVEQYAADKLAEERNPCRLVRSMRRSRSSPRSSKAPLIES